jgi:hypothetical protein
MIKSIIHHIYFSVKAISLFLILCAIQFFAGLFMASQINKYLKMHHSIYTINLSDILSFFQFEGIIGIIAVSLAITIIIYFDVRLFLNETMIGIKESLTERKINEAFPEFYEASSFSDVYKNLNSLLGLYKSFDHMKTARLSLEISSVKQLMNMVGEGVMLINKEHVVTHVNHVGEKLLKLIPGEIIGETVSRKVSNDKFLEFVERGLEYDQKVISERIEIAKNYFLSLSVIPVKDKYGEVVRALVLMVPTATEPIIEAEPN